MFDYTKKAMAALTDDEKRLYHEWKDLEDELFQKAKELDEKRRVWWAWVKRAHILVDDGVWSTDGELLFSFDIADIPKEVLATLKGVSEEVNEH